VPEENFWTSWCKGRLTEADTPTIQLGAIPSRLTSACLLTNRGDNIGWPKNVGTSLLLDDALKPATPLINGAIRGVAGLSASSSSKEDTLNI